MGTNINYAEINLEEGHPAVADAMKSLKDAIGRFKREKRKCVLVIHGYGSTGKGGKIGEKARQWLMAQKRNETVKDVIFGEDFDIFHAAARELKGKYRELERLADGQNHGVTVVVL